MAEYANFFKVGHDEAENIWGWGWSAEDCARHFQQTNGGIVVVTRGMEGAVAFDGVNLLAHDGFKVEIVDPVGAGDAFVAGFLGTVLENTDLKTFLAMEPEGRIPVLTYALRVANVCGALTCTRNGDTTAMPSMAEVNRFLYENV
jgi:sugar/nucleoside kinase (ribokinase family)